MGAGSGAVGRVFVGGNGPGKRVGPTLTQLEKLTSESFCASFARLTRGLLDAGRSELCMAG